MDIVVRLTLASTHVRDKKDLLRKHEIHSHCQLVQRASITLKQMNRKKEADVLQKGNVHCGEVKEL